LQAGLATLIRLGFVAHRYRLKEKPAVLIGARYLSDDV
jgi:hypothetical protein